MGQDEKMLVPVEPTDAMVEAAYEHWLNKTGDAGRYVVRNIIKAALSAAPTPGQPLSEADVLPCTDCDGTGITTQSERPCSCSAGDAYRPHAPVSRPGDGVGANRECRACGAFKPDRDAACTFCGAALSPPAEPVSRPAGEGEREAVARAVDPEAWAENLPVPTRADVIDFHARRQASIVVADRILSLLRPAAPDAGGWTADKLTGAVSDETMRHLLSAKDVGSGRARLASILNALQPGGER